MPLPKPPKTWVLVADAAQGLIFDMAAPAPKLTLVEKITMPHDPASEPSDRAGRYPDAGPGQRSAIGEPDHGEREKEAHARILADRLAADLRRGRFERLALVAPPRMIGLLRKAFPDDLSRAVSFELTEDLTNHPVPKIEEKLSQVLRP